MRRGTGRPVLILTALIFLLSAGCFWDPPPERPPVPPPDPVSPEGVVRGIEWAYNYQDLNFYIDMLDPDFTFYFDPRDIQDYGTPSSWGYDEEIEATRNLFDSVDDGAIKLTMTIEDYREPGPDDEVWDLNGVDYYLSVVTGDMTYQADGFANFRTRKNGLWKGQPRWWLWKWWDIAN
ncbi:hypothetical protein KAU45_06260 [bacterium]|nr:hypothetical protein [bacterium]